MSGVQILLRIGIAVAAALITAAVQCRIAGRKGRDTLGWFLSGFLPGLVGFLILVFVFKSLSTIGRQVSAHPGLLTAGFILVLGSLVVLLMLPALATPGQTKACPKCRSIVPWRAALCPACDAGLDPAPTKEAGYKVRRPLRRFYLYLFLIILLLLIIFGFIGYYCVPNQPQA